MRRGTIDIMMLRATVVDVNPRDPTRVWVTIPQKYGNKPVRVFTRVQVTKGDHVYVTNTSVTRVPQWVVFDHQTEIGWWGNPYPHTHPIGQVDGLVDWVKEYEAWAKDHAARLDAADKRIAEGKVEVDAARKDLNQAQTDIAEAVRKATLERARLDQAEANLDQMGRNLTAAGGRISANETALAGAQRRIETAEATVQKTATDLTAVDSRLTTTAGNLTTLQGTVGNVQSAVLESDRKAAAAQTAADQASSAAGSAASKATAAQTTADQAKAAAGTADEAARAASGLAATKGEVIYQATAPTGARAVAQNLWIRTTDNKPHTWNGSAWVAVTDKAATDAATAAATAQSAASTAQATADQAKADAAAAAQSAASAMTKAGQAQASADGKNRITRSTSPASQPGTAVGDTHFTMSSMGGGGVVTRQQRWDGSTWQDESVGHQVLASLDLGKATVGELDGAYIKANSILSNRVVVSAGENLVPDPTFLSDAMNTSRITGTAWRIGTAANGSKVLTTNSSTQSDVPLTGAPDGWMQVDSTAKYQLQMLAGGPDQLSTYLMLLFVDGKSKADGFQWVRGLTGTLSPKLVEWDMAALGGPVAVRPMIRRNPTPSGATNFYTQVGAVSFRRKVGTVLIEDGAVTGDKVEAQTVAAKVGQFVKVQAQNVEVTGDLSARVVNAMDTNTKNLVVTESAILNRATVVQSLVTPELITQKADVGTLAANMVAAGAIVSRDSTGSVQINPSGIVVRDAAPGSTSYTRQVRITPAGITGGTRTTPTVNIDGQNNWMVGEFSTAPSGQRVKISNNNSVAAVDLYASRSTSDHVGIWYDSPDTNVLNSVGRILAISGSSYTRDSPGLEMWPMRGTFGFRGRWQQETDATKFVEIFNNNGLNAGAWAQIEIPFQSAFPTNNSLLFPLVSAERGAGADVVVMVQSVTARSITMVVVNKSNSGNSGAIKLRAAVFNLNS